MLELLLFNLLTTATVVLALIYSVWLIHLVLDDASLIDLVWGAGFGLIAIVLFTLAENKTPWKVLLAALPVIWAVRYTTFITLRNLGHGEDARYTKLRQEKVRQGWSWPVFSFFGVYGFQALAMIVVASPLIVGMAAGAEVECGWGGLVGAALWMVGFAFESIGDLQLELFKKKHRDYDGDYADKPVLAQGLWRYTRHPNYFGNACMWWGIGIIACAAPWGWWGLVGPAFMNFALVYLTGKANNESRMMKRKAYQSYVRRTSGFFPLPPRG